MTTEISRVSETTIPKGESSTPTLIASPPDSTRPQSLLNQEAFDYALPAANALSKQELLPVNIDVTTAISTAVRALPKILAFRDGSSKLPGFDISHFDHLELHICAAGHAHAKLLAAAPPEAIATLSERGFKLRDAMYLDAVALAHRALLDGARIADFKTKVGYKNLAVDLVGLSALFRESWDGLASRTGVQLDELDEALLLGQQLMEAVTAREQAREIVAQAQAQRQRTFTLFARSYDQVRRAIGFLRWDHDDLDQICPSLFAGRGGRRKAMGGRGAP